MVFLATYTSNVKQSWQEAADLCAAEGKILPIPRNKEDADALCALAPYECFISIGIRKGAQPKSYINYLDGSPAKYRPIATFTIVPSFQCFALMCFNSVSNPYKFANVRCGENMVNFCENPRKYPSENLIDTLYRKINLF